MKKKKMETREFTLAMVMVVVVYTHKKDRKRCDQLRTFGVFLPESLLIDLVTHKGYLLTTSTTRLDSLSLFIKS